MENLKKEEKKNKKDKTKHTRVITKNSKQEELENKKRRAFLISILILITILGFFLLVNNTFFRTKYKNDKFEIDLPLFTYFISDKDNELTLKTLKKSEALKQYFEEYLSNHDYCTCEDGTLIYYDEKNNNMIKYVNIKKGLIFTKIEIKYDTSLLEEICKQ